MSRTVEIQKDLPIARHSTTLELKLGSAALPLLLQCSLQQLQTQTPDSATLTARRAPGTVSSNTPQVKAFCTPGFLATWNVLGALRVEDDIYLLGNSDGHVGEAGESIYFWLLLTLTAL